MSSATIQDQLTQLHRIANAVRALNFRVMQSALSVEDAAAPWLAKTFTRDDRHVIAVLLEAQRKLQQPGGHDRIASGR